MNRTWVLALLAIQIIASAYEYESIKSDLQQGYLPVEAAKHAYKNDELSENAVRRLVNNNVDVVKAVQAVAKTWGSCDDTYASVKEGVKIAPNRADEIVASIATIQGCKCNAQSFWARSRLEQRLRPRIQRALVQISQTCSCASAGIEAAMEIVPEKAEDMIDAVIVAKNRAERTVDSIGQVGKLPEKRFWGENLVTTKNTNLLRGNKICTGDRNELNNFDPEETWINQNTQTDLPLFNFNKKLGQHVIICDEDDYSKDDEYLDKYIENRTNSQNQEQEDLSKNYRRLIISQYVEGKQSNQALEFYNGSSETIDLLRENYQVEVFFHGYDFPGEVIQLKGIIEPKSTFVLAASGASSEIQKAANQKVSGLSFKGADAIVLKTGFPSGPCECAVSTVASAINGVDKNNNYQDEMSETKKDFIKRIEHHYENTEVQTKVVDSIGQILINDYENENYTPIDRPIVGTSLVGNRTLRRKTNTCAGDRVEMNPFNLADQWKRNTPNNFSDAGCYAKQECSVSRKDLLLSEYIQGDNKSDLIELFNGTDRPIDFATEKYILEIYNDDDENPEHEIYLDGNIPSNGTFVVASSEGAKQCKANLEVPLDLSQARAVVLKKVIMPAYQGCYAQVGNWLSTTTARNITYTLTPIFDPGVGPQTDDDPRDGDDGGELASPN